MMKILAGVEEVSDGAIRDIINDRHVLNNNSHEKTKSVEESRSEKPLLEEVSFSLSTLDFFTSGHSFLYFFFFFSL
jgi:hypothetical protein